MPKKTEREETLGLFNIHSVAKLQKIERGTFWSRPVLYVTRETFLVQYLGPTGTFWGLLNFVELWVELFWSVQVVLKKQ